MKDIETIIKALETFPRRATILYGVHNNEVVTFQDVIDYVNNLHDENERLNDMEFTKEHCDLYKENEWLKAELKRELVEHEEFTKRAKAEIERLTEENERVRERKNEVLHRNLELRKQVDELKENNKQLIDDGYLYQRKYELLEYDVECLKNHNDDGIRRAVKDTAPLAIQRFINQLYIDRIITDSDLENEMLKVKSFVLKRYYGVEVE